MIKTRPLQDGDVKTIYLNMYEDDLVDLTRGWGEHGSVQELLEQASKGSDECLVIVDDDEVLGMFGVWPGGRVWLVRTKSLDRAAIRFVRHGHEYIEKWLKKYGCLTGTINSKYTKFVRWLKREGFIMNHVGMGYLRIGKWT